MGTLDGVTWQGALGQDGGIGTLSIKDGITLKNTARTGPGTLGIHTGTVGSTFGFSVVNILDANTLDNLTIELGGAGSLNGSVSFPLVLGSTATVNHLGTLFAQVVGTIEGVELDNHGSINADSSGGLLVVDSATFDNFGSIVVAGGDHLQADGTFSKTPGRGLPIGSQCALHKRTIADICNATVEALKATVTTPRRSFLAIRFALHLEPDPSVMPPSPS